MIRTLSFSHNLRYRPKTTIGVAGHLDQLFMTCGIALSNARSIRDVGAPTRRDRLCTTYKSTSSGMVCSTISAVAESFSAFETKKKCVGDKPEWQSVGSESLIKLR